MAEQAQAEGAAAAEGESSLLDDILTETRMKPSDDGYSIAKQGVQVFISELMKPTRAGTVADRLAVDAMISELDEKIGAQVNEILHNADFKRMESMWRGVKFMMDRVKFDENIKIEILNLSKDDLEADLEDAPDLTKSGFFRLAYSNEYGQFGGEPYGFVHAAYEFGPSAKDMALLKNIAAISAMAHAPTIANVNPKFFGEDSFLPLPKLKDLKAMLEGPQCTKWNAFRDNPDSCYVGLAMPRFMLRPPYDPENNPIKKFRFTEDVIDQHKNYCWGYASHALVERICDSFANFRWCPNIIGPQAGGTVKDLPLHIYEQGGEIITKTPTEIMLTERREFELAEEGFIALTFRKDSDNACFFSANSCQKPKFFGTSAEAKEAETNFKLGTQLPYMSVITRLAHYLKVIQREQLGSFKERTELESELNLWISQYVSDMDAPTQRVRATRPLRKAQVVVEDVPGQPGWFQCKLAVQPHMKYMGASFTLSLVGRLDK